MTIVKDNGCDGAKVQETIKKSIPTAIFEENGGEIKCILPIAQVTQFPAIFEELENKKTELRIGSYGVGSTTMEEIFLRSRQILHFNPTNLRC